MKETIKQEIYEAASAAKVRCLDAAATLTDTVSLDEYRPLAFEGVHGTVWTTALQTALQEHERIVIPASEAVYWLDDTVVIPSGRYIEAEGAVIRLVPEFPYIMLRNEHTHDGTRAPIPEGDRDSNITIHGGRWEESSTRRGIRGYAKDCKGFHGVQTCMLFNNVERLMLSDLTFAHTTSFSVQVGDLTDGVFENFSFDKCYADGLHVNGNCENLFIRNFNGYVGDDLVALNMYDWLGSSINYGPACNVFCEDIHSEPDSPAKAMRLQPGIFIFEDGHAVDCSLENMYFRRISGIYEYKLYLQTPPYRLGEKPESGGVGSADNLFFEDIDIEAGRPWYLPDVPVRGNFGMFILNSNIGRISFEHIRYTHAADISPRSWLFLAGPISNYSNNREIFDPYASGTVELMELENIFVNGERAADIDRILKVIRFDNINNDGFSSGCGKINRLLLDGKEVVPMPAGI